MVLDGKVDDAHYEGSDALLNEDRCIERWRWKCPRLAVGLGPS